jgi:hypothetical protein
VKKTTPRTLLAFCSLATVAALDMLGVDDETMEPDRRWCGVPATTALPLELLIFRPLARLVAVAALAEALTMRMGCCCWSCWTSAAGVDREQ